MDIGHAKLVQNTKKPVGPIGQEANEYVDIWVQYAGNQFPLRCTTREFGKVAERAAKQRDEIEPLADQPVDPFTISAVTFMAGVAITLIVLSFF